MALKVPGTVGGKWANDAGWRARLSFVDNISHQRDGISQPPDLPHEWSYSRPELPVIRQPAISMELREYFRNKQCSLKLTADSIESI